MLNRRSFLRGTVLVAGATVTSKLVGCGDEAAAEGAADTAAGSDLGTGGDDTESGDAAQTGDVPQQPGPAVDGAAWFPQSIASGDPRPDGLILWARAVDPKDATRELAVSVQVATDDAFTEIVTLSGKAAAVLLATAEADHCLKVRLEGLTPGATYYYRFVVENAADARYASRTGRTRTARHGQ